MLAGALAASSPATAISLRDAAAAAGIHVGAAANSFEIGTPAGDLLVREFDSLTPENEMKWSQLSPAPFVYDFESSDALVAFAEANAMRVRGHTFVWGRPNGPTDWLAADLAAATDPAARLQALMLDQIATVGDRYAGRIHTWDVVNEPLVYASGALDASSPYFALLGETFLADAFRAARAADPYARLYLNETNTERLPGKFASLLALAEGLLARDVPLDGIGLQGHFLAAPRKADLLAQLRAIEALGLEAEITELDLPLLLFATSTDPLAAQARAYADVFSACLEVSACKGITMWGISDAHTWLDTQPFFEFYAPNQPLLFDAQGLPKPAYDAVLATLLAVPEPGTAAVVGLGLGALAIRRRARRCMPGRSRTEGMAPAGRDSRFCRTC